MTRKRCIAICCEKSLMLAGGLEVLTRELVEGISEHYEVILVSGAEDKEIKGVTKHLLWDCRRPSYAAGRKLARELKALGAELVHFHGGGPYSWGGRLIGRHPAVACRREGLRCIVSTHLVETAFSGYCGPQKPLWFKAALFPAAWLSRFALLGNVLREITDSVENRDRLRRLWWPFRNRIISLYHSRIHENLAPALSYVDREPLILNAATIAVRKGQITLVEAFARLAAKYPEWKLGFAGYVGEPDYLETLKAKIAEHRLEERVSLLGILSAAELDRLMQKAAIFAFPSIEEALGLALQEALYNGCAAIGSDTGGIPELIDDEKNGLLIPPGSVDALTEALERLMSNASLRSRFSRHAHESILAKAMTVERMVENHRKLYESLLPQP